MKRRRKKKKTSFPGLPRTHSSSVLIISIDMRIKILAEMVDKMNKGEQRFSLEEFIQQFDSLLIQLQANGGEPLWKEKIVR